MEKLNAQQIDLNLADLPQWSLNGDDLLPLRRGLHIREIPMLVEKYGVTHFHFDMGPYRLVEI